MSCLPEKEREPMKTYLVCSDIHRNLHAFQKMVDSLPGADGIICAGDLGVRAEEVRKIAGKIPLYMVRGNVDGWYSSDLPETIAFSAQGHRIMVTHGHLFAVPSTSMLRREAEERKADIVIFGHIHRYFRKEDKGILYLNPGALSGCRDTGRRSWMILELADDGSIHTDYIEL